jgi:hypothetical protein
MSEATSHSMANRDFPTVLRLAEESTPDALVHR